MNLKIHHGSFKKYKIKHLIDNNHKLHIITIFDNIQDDNITTLETIVNYLLKNKFTYIDSNFFQKLLFLTYCILILKKYKLPEELQRLLLPQQVSGGNRITKRKMLKRYK